MGPHPKFSFSIVLPNLCAAERSGISPEPPPASTGPTRRDSWRRLRIDSRWTELRPPAMGKECTAAFGCGVLYRGRSGDGKHFPGRNRLDEARDRCRRGGQGLGSYRSFAGPDDVLKMSRLGGDVATRLVQPFVVSSVPVETWPADELAPLRFARCPVIRTQPRDHGLSHRRHHA